MKNNFSYYGEDGTRTHNFIRAKHILYQLSYYPILKNYK